jgi:predicted phage gp36 major capsid-like protein
MKCQICANQKRSEIERDALGGRPLLVVARNHNCSGDALWRHMRNHLARPSAEPVTSEQRDKARERRETNDRLKMALKSKLIKQLQVTDDPMDTARLMGRLLEIMDIEDRQDAAASAGGTDEGDGELPPRVVILDEPLFQRWRRETQGENRAQVVLPLNHREGLE